MLAVSNRNYKINNDKMTNNETYMVHLNKIFVQLSKINSKKLN